MGKIREFNQRLKQLTPSKVEQLALDVVKKNEQVAVNQNTDQLFEGKRSDGASLPDYSRTSVEVFGKPDGPIRLFDTGDFYSGFFLEAGKFPVLFNSRDSKTAMLVQRYGEKIFGLDKENFSDFARAHILPDLQKEIRKILQLQ